jgi:hypothetical protein
MTASRPGRIGRDIRIRRDIRIGRDIRGQVWPTIVSNMYRADSDPAA